MPEALFIRTMPFCCRWREAVRPLHCLVSGSWATKLIRVLPTAQARSKAAKAPLYAAMVVDPLAARGMRPDWALTSMPATMVKIFVGLTANHDLAHTLGPADVAGGIVSLRDTRFQSAAHAHRSLPHSQDKLRGNGAVFSPLDGESRSCESCGHCSCCLIASFRCCLASSQTRCI